MLGTITVVVYQQHLFKPPKLYIGFPENPPCGDWNAWPIGWAVFSSTCSDSFQRFRCFSNLGTSFSDNFFAPHETMSLGQGTIIIKTVSSPVGPTIAVKRRTSRTSTVDKLREALRSAEIQWWVGAFFRVINITNPHNALLSEKPFKLPVHLRCFLFPKGVI